MAKTHERVFALVLALLFLATSVATGAIVIWQVRKDNENNKQAASETASQTDTTNNQQENQNMLQGTKLEGFTPIAKIDTLQKIDLVPGTGEEVKAGATVTAHYTGAVAADGTIFQSSHDSGQPIPFSLSGVIQGWTEGVPGMKVGGKRRLLIPAAMAYGANPPAGSGIPANADLVFDIELVAVQQ
jgi:FKBP-type peptidyl-prolyl cis-trans isomerase